MLLLKNSLYYDLELSIIGFWDVGKEWVYLNMSNTYNLMMIKKELSEQIIRGDIRKLNISSILIRSIEESDKKINEIPKLKFCKIKERILENFIYGKIEKSL